MYTRTFLALGLASLPGVVQPATAGQSELEQIRAEMREMRQAYETRIEALENRIEELEGRQETAAAETAAPAEPARRRLRLRRPPNLHRRLPRPPPMPSTRPFP